jgi:DNA-binding MarR family transcriptional regulator
VLESLQRLFRAMQEHSKAVQSTAGLSAPQLIALRLTEAEPGISIGEVARRMFAHPSTVSGVIDRLESRGAIRRLTDAEDRRSIRLELTPAGRRLLRGAPEPVHAGLARALRSMPRERLAQLRRTLDAVVEQTESARVRRRPGR